MNRLAEETSPYLLQHADNPVDWYPWGEEALGRARAEDKPILLSVGYAACHWCHVMAHESFEDDATAAQMNELFVNVKVDREERPDLDALYMDAVVALTGHGGWPMTVFLTPEASRSTAAPTSRPSRATGCRASGRSSTRSPRRTASGRDDVARTAEQLVEAIRSGAEVRPSTDPLTESILGEAARALGRIFDPAFGGFGGAPKFPPASALELLMRRGELSMVTRRRSTPWPPEACTTWSAAASTATRSTSAGSSRTSRRCSTTTRCSSRRTSTAGSSPGRSATGEIVEETVEYMLRDLALPEGAFASSQDADTEGVEGLTYTWTADEVGPEVAPLLEPFEHGRSIIRGELSTRDAVRACLRSAPSARSPVATTRRSPPGTGSPWRRSPRRGGGSTAPTGSTRPAGLPSSCSGRSRTDGRLHRSYRAGRASGTGYLDDYANVAHGLYELHVATGELRWLEESRRLALLAVELFADDERGGFYMSPADGEQLVARTKDLDDNPIPSGNSMLAYALLRLARIYGDDELERRAVSVFRLLAPSMARNPSFFAWALCALDLHFSPPREIAIVGVAEDEVAKSGARRLRSEHRRRVRPERGRAPARGQDAGGRQADRLCLRALRLPGARHGSGGASLSCENARSNTSRGCAPSTSRRRSSRKPGTPVMPMDTACAVSPCTRSRYASAREHLVHLGPVQPGLDRERPQLVRVADVPSLGPVGVHEPVVHGGVQAALPCELRDAEGPHRVRHDLGRRVVVEPFLGEPVLQPVVERGAVARVQLLARDPLRRVLRVEVEGEPGDLGAEPARDPVGRRLAEPAERSDVVGPDQDVRRHQTAAVMVIPPRAFCVSATSTEPGSTASAAATSSRIRTARASQKCSSLRNPPR